jgi:soluble lytic murein transglycosylase-like protein
MSDIRIDDDGFLVGDGEQQRTEAENVLMREIKADTTTIVNLLKGTVKLQRETLKATQNNSSPKPNGGNNGGNGSNNQQPKVNLVHPNRAAPTPLPPTPLPPTPLPPTASNAPTPLPPTARPNQQGAGNNNQSPNNSNSAGQGAPNTARINRQRDANGRFVGSGDNAESTESNNAQGRGNRDSRGRFTGGNGQNAAERSAVSRITDSLKDLNNNLTLNANTDRIDPTIDAIKELGSIASVGIDAGKKALSVSNTLIAKPAMALGRGIKGLFKPKTDAINSPVAWYKRIWRTLERGNRQDQTQHAQEQRRLDELVRGQGQRGSADSGFLMMLGLGIAALLAAIKNIKFPSLDDIKDKLKGLGTDNQSPFPVLKFPKFGGTIIQAFKWLSETKVGQTVSKFLKRLPFISSAIEAGAGGINAVNIANDANLTEEQKQRKQLENAGSTVGAIGGGLGGTTAGMAAGGLIGTAIFPVVGTAVGTVVGGLVGSWLGTEGGRIVGGAIGGWVDDLANVDIAGRISNAWNGFLTPLQPIFNRINDTAMSVFNAVGKTWSDFVADTKMRFGEIVAGLQAVADFFANVGDTWNTWIKNATGIDVKENLKRSKEAIGKKVDNANDYAGQKLDQAGQFFADVGQSIKNTPIVEAVGGFFSGLTTETDKEKQLKKAKQQNNTTQANYQKYKPLLESVYTQKGFKDSQAQAFLKAQVEAESGFNPNAVSKKGAFGLTQFMPETAKQYGVDKNNVQSQVVGQAKYMSYLLKRYGGDWDKALAGYNYGEGNVDKVIAKANKQNVDWRTFLPEETKNYLVKIKTKALNYGALTNAQIAAQSPTTTPQQPIAKAETVAPPTLKSAPVNAMPIQNVNAVAQVQAKEIQTRLNNAPTPIKVSIQKPMVSQNVSDRGIAHIVTGGIGEAM